MGESEIQVKRYKPVHIGVATHFLGRYREFDFCLARLIYPPGSSFQYYMSVDVALNFNHMADFVMNNPEYEYLWILGDDHLFADNLLINLMDRNVDIVTPLCVRRMFPYEPILHYGPDHPERPFCSIEKPWDILYGKSGLIEWHGTSGNAGMLIRRTVFEAMSPPYFEPGKTWPGVNGSDIYFWHKAQQAGFKTYLDLDNVIGHITHTSVWPKQDPETGKWSFLMRSP